jgi:hypothetical protein
MARNIFKIENGKVRISNVAPVGAIDVCSMNESSFPTELGCQVTSAGLSTSQNVSREEVPATWCAEAESTIASVVDEQTVDLTFILDEDQADGVASWLYENSGKTAYVWVQAGDGEPPSMYAEVRAVAPTLFGEARTVRTATVSLPVEGKAAVCFGKTGATKPVGNPAGGPPTGATSGTPGAWTPVGSTPPATVSAAIALGLTGLGAAWAAGEYVYVGTPSGTPAASSTNSVHWDGTQFVAGAAPTA